MNRQQEQDYLELINQANMTAYHAFITAHQGVVYKLAARYSPKNSGGPSVVSFEDLVGDGQLALCESPYAYLKKYGPEGPCKFITFAYNRVRVAMISRLRTDETVQKTEWRARLIAAANKEYDALANRLGRAPTFSEFEHKHGAAAADIIFNGQHQYVSDETLAEVQEADIELSIDQSIEYKRLPLSQRILLDTLKNNNVSMGAVSDNWGMNRSDVVDIIEDTVERVY